MLDKKYIAGLFDGEGSLGIYKRKDRRIKRGFSISYRLRIVNQYLPILDELHKKYGGRIYKNSNKKECWQWEADTKEQILSFLKDHLKYLIIKKEKAVKVYNYLKNKSKGRGKYLDESDIKFIKDF